MCVCVCVSRLEERTGQRLEAAFKTLFAGGSNIRCIQTDDSVTTLPSSGSTLSQRLNMIW